VASGPGSFTGLRIGIAAIQGLAFVTGRRIVAVSTLEALAQAGSDRLEPGSLVAAWMDARRRDVFSALYRVTPAAAFTRGRLVQMDPPMVAHPDAILERWASLGAPDVFVGDGATMFASLLPKGSDVRPMPHLAAVIGRMAVDRGRAGESVPPGGVQPPYVRRPDAEIARDKIKGLRPGASPHTS
jgi:tRNA threonylcarbamoyl adenosine modification protein YeaZ